MNETPAGQQQAPGPPTPSGLAAQPMGSQPPGQDGSSNTGFGNKVDITASLIVNDRSRDQPEGDKGLNEESYENTKVHEEIITLAGPMRDWDPLYIIMIIQALLICICAACALFIPYSFTIHDSFEQSTDKHYGLFRSVHCSKSKAHEETHPLCYEGSESLGLWVLMIQIFGSVGLGLSVISLALQMVNLCCNPRNKRMHDASLSLMATASTCMLIAGHIIHNRSVWAEVVETSPTKRVAIEPISGALYLVCTLLASWHCVLAHVSTHAPGPLSRDTRFAHTFQEEPVIKRESLVPPDISLTMGEVSDRRDSRKDSVVSTEV